MRHAKPILFALLLTLTACASLYVTRSEITSLRQGMTEKEVVEKIGRPIDVNRTRTQHGERAQFVYKITAYERAYVYFEDYRLTSIQY